MADTQIVFPRHSFVNNIANASCEHDAYCLPMSRLTDWKFQAFITSIGTPPNPDANTYVYYAALIQGAECSGTLPLAVRYLSRIPATVVDLPDPLTLQDGTVVIKVLNFTGTPPYNFVNYQYQELEAGEWQAVITDEIADGECFQMVIIEDIIAEDAEDPEKEVIQRTILSCTSCFQKVPAPSLCFWSRFTYQNNENSNGFIYSPGSFINTGLLPFYLTEPGLPDERTVYVMSNGAEKKLYERTSETFLLETDYFDFRVHKCMKVMLCSDSIGVTNEFIGPRESTNIISKEEYEFDFAELGSDINRKFKAKTRVTSASPISLINSNCG